LSSAGRTTRRSDAAWIDRRFSVPATIDTDKTDVCLADFCDIKSADTIGDEARPCRAVEGVGGPESLVRHRIDRLDFEVENLALAIVDVFDTLEELE
jgi:hypothetical protein